MQQLLRGHVHLLSLAVGHGDLLALVPGDLLAVGSGLGGAVRRLLNLAGECVGHLGPLAWCRFMVPQLLLVGACHIRHNELHVLGHQFALLPGHRLTVVSSSPDLKIGNYTFEKSMKWGDMDKLTCSPLLSVSHSVTQFCFVTFLHSGSSFW